VLAIVVETKYFLPTLAITPHFFIDFFSMLAIVIGFPTLVVHVLISLSMPTMLYVSTIIVETKYSFPTLVVHVLISLSMPTMLYVSTIIVETKYSFPTLVIGIHFSMPTMWCVSTIVVEIEHSSSQPISTL
jgi:hypothetical protein